MPALFWHGSVLEQGIFRDKFSTCLDLALRTLPRQGLHKPIGMTKWSTVEIMDYRKKASSIPRGPSGQLLFLAVTGNANTSHSLLYVGSSLSSLRCLPIIHPFPLPLSLPLTSSAHHSLFFPSPLHFSTLVSILGLIYCPYIGEALENHLRIIHSWFHWPRCLS